MRKFWYVIPASKTDSGYFQMVIYSVDSIRHISSTADLFCVYGPSDGEYKFELFDFWFKVEGKLIHEDFAYGIFGPITEGPAFFHGLICSAMHRMPPYQDWDAVSEDYVNFRIGLDKVRKNPSFNEEERGVRFFRHPEGTVIDGYPFYGRHGVMREV